MESEQSPSYGAWRCGNPVRQVFATCSEGTGTLYVGKFQRSSYVSVKVFDLEQYRDISFLIEEVLLMRQFSHPNLLQCFGSFVRGSELMVVLPLVVYGSVKDLLNTHYQCGFSELMCAAVLWDVLAALEYLHSRGYIHRSVKASHLLISGSGRVILTGLGDAFNCVKGGEMRVRAFKLPRMAKCSFPWLSPEVLAQVVHTEPTHYLVVWNESIRSPPSITAITGGEFHNLRGYCKKSDIYSVGILACELANGAPPYEGISSTELLLMKLTGCFIPRLHDCTTIVDLHLDLESTQDALPADSGVFESLPTANLCQSRYQTAANRTFNSEFHDFVDVCVQRDVDVRPSACELRRHSFFSVNKKFWNCLKEALASVQPLVCLSRESDTSSLESTPLNLDYEKVDTFEWSFD